MYTPHMTGGCSPRRRGLRESGMSTPCAPMSRQRIAMPSAANQPCVGPQRADDLAIDLLVVLHRREAAPPPRNVRTFGARHGVAVVAIGASYARGAAVAGRMVDLLQVDHRGVGVELLEHVIGALVVARACATDQFGSAASPNMIARDGQACAHATVNSSGSSSRCSSVARFSASRMRCTQKRALLHHALAAHRDVRVELPVERLGERVLRAVRLAVAEPVEVANLVRAVVRAVARADAAVVDLHVQPVRRVIRRVHRADRLARRVAALLAEHRDERASRSPDAEPSARDRSLEVALETDPGHLAAARDVRAEAGAVRRRRVASCQGAPTVGMLFSA